MRLTRTPIISGANPLFTWTNPIHLYGLFLTGITMFFDICYTIDNFKTKFGLDVYSNYFYYITKITDNNKRFGQICLNYRSLITKKAIIVSKNQNSQA